MKITYKRSVDKAGGGIFAGLGCFAVFLYLAFWGFIAWAIVHFILKYW